MHTIREPRAAPPNFARWCSHHVVPQRLRNRTAYRQSPKGAVTTPSYSTTPAALHPRSLYANELTPRVHTDMAANDSNLPARRKTESAKHCKSVARGNTQPYTDVWDAPILSLLTRSRYLRSHDTAFSWRGERVRDQKRIRCSISSSVRSGAYPSSTTWRKRSVLTSSSRSKATLFSSS